MADLSTRSGSGGTRWLTRQVVATGLLSVLWVGVEELRPRRLKGYGSVDPGVAEALDPLADEIAARLDPMFRLLRGEAA